MGSQRISIQELAKLKLLRKRGYSISEISRSLNRSEAAVAKRVSGIKVDPNFLAAWKAKRGGSSLRAQKRRKLASTKATNVTGKLTGRDLLLIAACLYWGEGNKRDFSFTNSDPNMIRVLVKCLKVIGVSKERIRVGIRIYEDIEAGKAKEFWAGVVGIEVDDIIKVEVLCGRKTGKLPFGMCRLRISKGNDCFNLLMATVELMSNSISP